MNCLTLVKLTKKFNRRHPTEEPLDPLAILRAYPFFGGIDDWRAMGHRASPRLAWNAVRVGFGIIKHGGGPHFGGGEQALPESILC